MLALDGVLKGDDLCGPDDPRPRKTGLLLPWLRPVPLPPSTSKRHRWEWEFVGKLGLHCLVHRLPSPPIVAVHMHRKH